MKVQKRTVLKFAVLIALLGVFYVYYFRVVFKQFTEQLTNTAKFEEKITFTEPPTITLCFDPRFKPSVFEKYNITNWIFFGDYFPKVMENKTIKASGHFLTLTLLGLGLIKINDVSANFNMPRPSLILNN